MSFHNEFIKAIFFDSAFFFFDLRYVVKVYRLSLNIIDRIDSDDPLRWRRCRFHEERGPDVEAERMDLCDSRRARREAPQGGGGARAHRGPGRTLPHPR